MQGAVTNQLTACFFNQSEAKPKPIVSWSTRVFPRLAPVPCFLALSIGYMFFRA